MTLPGRGEARGRPASGHRARLRIEQLFRQAGFDVADRPRDRGRLPQLRSAEHPRQSSGARDARHVLLSRRRRLLRTHTSPVQIRAHAARGKPPFAVIAPGRVYRMRFGRHAHADVPPGRRPAWSTRASASPT